MEKITSLILLLNLILSSCNQQNSENYNSLITEARESFASGEYKNSGEIYSQAFALQGSNDSIAHQYEAAQSWARAGQKDSAFAQLFKIINDSKFSDIGKISSDRDLNSLATDKRWISILNKVSKNLKEAEARLSKVATSLENIHEDDQYYRQQLDGLQEKYGHDSEEIRAHWKLIQKQDSINLGKVEKILGEHGWLGWDLIGRRANSALFLVIQHAELETQEKYLPMLREAVKKGDAAPSDLALLEDRVALRKGNKQIYGSQIGRDQETGSYYVSPLQDPDNVDKRRAEVGLGPIQDYISNWELTWDAEAYKKKLPELEKREGI